MCSVSGSSKVKLLSGIGLGARQYAVGATIRGLGRGEQWLDRTLRIPRTPEGLAPPPDEVAPPQIIGRPSEVELLLNRAGQRAALQDARDIEAFTQGQMAEAEAEGFASAAEAAASRAEAAAAAEAGVAGAGILATAGEAALGVAGAAGAAAGGLERPQRWWAPPGPSIEGGSTRRATSWASRAGRAEARTATRAGAAARWTRSLGCSSTSLCARASASGPR